MNFLTHILPRKSMCSMPRIGYISNAHTHRHTTTSLVAVDLCVRRPGCFTSTTRHNSVRLCWTRKWNLFSGWNNERGKIKIYIRKKIRPCQKIRVCKKIVMGRISSNTNEANGTRETAEKNNMFNAMFSLEHTHFPVRCSPVFVARRAAGTKEWNTAPSTW